MQPKQLSTLVLALFSYGIAHISAAPLFNVPRPPRMGFWHPIRHLDLVDNVVVLGHRVTSGRPSAYRYVAQAHARRAQEQVVDKGIYERVGDRDRALAAAARAERHRSFERTFNERADLHQAWRAARAQSS